ncbi:MAG: MSMEG_4193 family putative phosphomutase [Streptosporangiales bacterium]|nr:MSMEG_4193 family putative phosphomutase [Streptosporangiales bacterium]
MASSLPAYPEGVTTVLLARHGRTSANASAVLAGRTPGVHLDDTGREQAATLAERLAPVPLAAIVSSPLERCRETARALAAGRNGTRPRTDRRLAEVRYGEWEGRELKELAKEPLWRAVQAHPSSVRFPGGEALRDVQVRAVDAIRDWNARLGGDATYLVCSHGDVIKAVVADALGMHLDLFQRIQVDPCSLTVIRYTELRPFVVRQNDRGGVVDDLLPPKKGRRGRKRASSDAVVGGGG